MEIRLGKKKDIPELIRMSSKTREVLDTQGWIEPGATYAISMQSGLLIIAEQDNIILGFLLGLPYQKTNSAQIVYTIVKPDYRNKGIGSKLVAEFISRCKKKKYSYVDLYGPSFNKKSIMFYKKVGFTKGHSWVYFSKKL